MLKERELSDSVIELETKNDNEQKSLIAKYNLLKERSVDLVISNLNFLYI